MNNQTSLDLTHITNRGPDRKPAQNISFKVKLDTNTCALDYIYVTLNVDGRIAVHHEKGEAPAQRVIEFEPRTHMRAPCVIRGGVEGDHDISIARGQGIGIIIVNSYRMHLGLMYKDEQHFPCPPEYCPIKSFQYTTWRGKEEDLMRFSAELSLGLDALYLEHEEAEPKRLCEPLDERDKEDTFPSPSPLAKFKPLKIISEPGALEKWFSRW